MQISGGSGSSVAASPFGLYQVKIPRAEDGKLHMSKKIIDRLHWLHPELIVDVRILSHLKLSNCSWQKNPWLCDCTIA